MSYLGATKNPQDEFFLPDFCQPQSLFLVVLVSELLAVIFTLLSVHPGQAIWSLLGLYSISVQIIALISISFLCWLRPFFIGYSDWVCGGLSLAIILITTLLFSLGVIHWYWLMPIDLTLQPQSHLVIRNLFIAGVIGSVTLRYFYLQAQYRKQLALESSSRLQALQARIRPHFLFNSMNVIASLTRIDPAKAESAIEDLSDLFRTTLQTRQELIPFAEELANSERYLAIEKLRLGERLQVNKSIGPQCESVMVPPLSVQPLLENAVYHGIQMLEEGGAVTIEAKQVNDEMWLQVSNPKNGKRKHQGQGMALNNIEQRLAVIYAGKASLQRIDQENEYQIIMKIPLQQSQS